MAASAISWGVRPIGHTVVHRPQRRQLVASASASSTGSSASRVSPLFCFWIGISRLPSAMPIIGPPHMAFLSVTPSLMPPADSSSSEKIVPSLTMKLPGFFAASPLRVSTCWKSGSW